MCSLSYAPTWRIFRPGIVVKVEMHLTMSIFWKLKFSQNSRRRRGKWAGSPLGAADWLPKDCVQPWALHPSQPTTGDRCPGIWQLKFVTKTKSLQNNHPCCMPIAHALLNIITPAVWPKWEVRRFLSNSFSTLCGLNLLLPFNFAWWPQVWPTKQH